MNRNYKLKDFAQDVSIAVKDAQSSPYDRFVGLEHYDSGEPVITRYTDTSLLSSSVKEFHANDILIARRNVYLRRAGIAFFDGLTSGDSIVLRIYDDCEQRTGIPKEDAIKIIPFILNSNLFWAYANKHADGMNSKRISKEMLYDYEFTLPSLAEQRVLADKLWAAYHLKESYRKLLASTQEMVKSQFIEMFASSDCVPLNSLVTLSKSSVLPKEGITYTLYSFPAFDNNQTPEVVDGGEIKSSKIVLEDNVVLFNKLNVRLARVWNISSLTTLNNVCSSEFLPLKVKEPNVISQSFLYRILSSDFVTKKMMDCSTGTSNSQKRIAPSSLMNLRVPLPPKDDQQMFVAIAEQADKSEFELRKSIESIDAVIKSLINS